jgi:transposase
MTSLKEQGYVRKIPHFNSISGYLSLPELHPILKNLLSISCSPLEELEDEFAVDSSGFSTGRYFEWMSTKFGAQREKRKAVWLKCHLTCGIMSHIVTAVQITDRCVNDHGQFVTLIEETSKHFQIKRVMADKAYLSAVNLRYVDDKGGVAFVPFKKNSRLGNKARDSVWQSLYWFFHLQNDRFRKFYGRRANVECTFSMIKRKFGERLRSKSVSAQMNEILCKILCHNICCVIHARHRMSIKPDFRRDSANQQ